MKAKFLLGIILGIVLLNSNAWCQLHFTELKGLQENLRLKPHYEYLHPLEGFALAKQSFLTNLYNYPNADDPEGNNSTRKRKIDDPHENFIQSLFNTAQGSDSPTFFQVSPLAEKVGRFLKPSTLGGILQILSQSDPKKSEINQLSAQLQKLIEEDVDFQHEIAKTKKLEEDYREELKSREAPVQKVKDELNSKKEERNKTASQKTKTRREHSQCDANTDEGKNKMETLAAQIVECDQKLNLHDEEIKKGEEAVKQAQLDLESHPEKAEAYKKLRFKIQQEAYKPAYLKEFISKLLKSWSKEGDPDPFEMERFPKHFTEQVLVTLAIMNTSDHDKAELLSLYQKLPQALAHGPNDPKLSGAWLKESYSREDYIRLNQKISAFKTPKKRADYLIKNREELAFLSYGRSFFESSTLPELGYKTVSYLHPKHGIVSFADCMDSSILNFIAIILRDPKTSLLNSGLLKHPNKIFPEFKKFIETHSEVSSLDSLDAHQAWIPLVQGLKNIQYVNGDYEMDTTLGNLFHVMEHLISAPISQSQVQSQTNSKKMDRLCELLSREDDFEIEWNIKSGKKEDLDKKHTNVLLEFTINGKHAFNWSITSSHSEIQVEKDSKKDWRPGVATTLASKIGKNKLSATDSKTQSLLWISGGLTNSEDYKKVMKELNLSLKPAQALHYRYMNPLVRVEDKLELFKQAFEKKTSHITQIPLDSVKRVLNSITQPDFHTQQLIHSALADSDYPFGDPPHALGKPNAIYKRVTHDTLKSKLGEDTAKQMGKSWMRELFGHKITIGEPLIDSTGNERKLKFQDSNGGKPANDACLDLNSKEQRPTVESSFKERETKLDQIRKTAYEDETQRQKELEKIHRNHPIPGCYLMSKEEWKILEGDFGFNRNNDQYIPQILPKLFNRWFWSSSGSPNDADSAFNFNGTYGQVHNAYRTNDKSVRCGCGASSTW